MDDKECLEAMLYHTYRQAVVSGFVKRTKAEEQAEEMMESGNESSTQDEIDSANAMADLDAGVVENNGIATI